MGRTHRPFYRICAADRRTPRDGRVIEELGTYDPSVSDTNARCTLNAARVDYWLGVGAQPSDKVRVLIKKFGTDGTHLKEMEEARARLSMPRIVPEAGDPVFVPAPPAPKEEPVAEAAAEASPDADATAETSTEATAEPVAEEATAPAEPTVDAVAEATAADAPVENSDDKKSE